MEESEINRLIVAYNTKIAKLYRKVRAPCRLQERKCDHSFVGQMEKLTLVLLITFAYLGSHYQIKIQERLGYPIHMTIGQIIMTFNLNRLKLVWGCKVTANYSLYFQKQKEELRAIRSFYFVIPLRIIFKLKVLL